VLGPAILDLGRWDPVEHRYGLAKASGETIPLARGGLVPHRFERQPGQAAHQDVSPPVMLACGMNSRCWGWQLSADRAEDGYLNAPLSQEHRWKQLENQVVNRVDGE